MYKVQLSRRAMRDISRIPSQYARLVSQRIHDLAEILVLTTQKGYAQEGITGSEWEFIEFSME